MKKSIICFVILTLILVASCDLDKSQNVVGNDHLIAISNVDSISSGTSKALVQGAPIEGVLLKFHNEGMYNGYDSEFTLSNPNAFYLEELKGTSSTWYGMEFNYVLYVPDCIQDAYKAGLGTNPNSGNPFWWYMSTYYGKSLSDIEGNWKEAFLILLENKDALTFPLSADVKGQWKGSKYSYADGLTVKLKFDNNFSVDVDSASNKTKVTIPSIIYFEYDSGFGKGKNSKDAFYWYMETYFRKTSSEINEMCENGTLGDWLSNLELCPPQAEDVTDYEVKEVSRSIDIESDAYSLYGVSCYIPERIEIANTTDTQIDESVCYISLVQKDDQTGFYLYVPRSYIEEWEEKFGTYNGSGDLVWKALKTRWNKDTSANVKNCSIEREYLEDLLTYKTGENFFTLQTKAGDN